MNYLKYIGMGLIGLLALYGLYNLVPKQNHVGAISTVTSNTTNLAARSLVLGENCHTSYGPCTLASVIDSSSNTDTGFVDNGIGISYVRQASVSGTTTPCNVLSPAATTTLNGFAFTPIVGTTTSATATIATSTSPNATTSLIATVSGYVPNVAITWEGGVNNTVVSPSTYVVLGLAAGSATGGFVMTGTCTATFQTIN